MDVSFQTQCLQGVPWGEQPGDPGQWQGMECSQRDSDYIQTL